MKKQLLLTLSFLSICSASSVEAAKGMAPVELLKLVGKIGLSSFCAERLWKFEQNSKFTKSGRHYAYGFEKIAYVGGSSILLAALWGQDENYFECRTAAALTLLCALTHAVANHELSAHLVKQVPVISDILSDYTNEKGEEVCSVGMMSRCLLTCALIRESLKYGAAQAGYDFGQYLLDFSK